VSAFFLLTCDYSIDQKHIPEWELFFQKLAAKIEDNSHTSVLQGVVRDLGGPVQRPVPYLQNVHLYQHDLVVPGTDTATVAQRQALLDERLDEANRARLLEGVYTVIYSKRCV